MVSNRFMNLSETDPETGQGRGAMVRAEVYALMCICRMTDIHYWDVVWRLYIPCYHDIDNACYGGWLPFLKCPFLGYRKSKRRKDMIRKILLVTETET